MMKCETAPLQNIPELNIFVWLLQRENVKSYLEIGSKFGGSLWAVANGLPVGSRVVSVDLPHGDGSFKESESPLKECIQALRDRGYDAHLFLGDSADQTIVSGVRTLAPFDAVFIDGNHYETHIRKDWKNYGPMGRLVAFHDINWKKSHLSGKKVIEVPKVWEELKRDYKYQEIKCCKANNGIGVLWMI